MTITEEIREACAWVAQRSEHVRVETDRIGDYVASLPLAEISSLPGFDAAPAGAARETAAERETTSARWLTLDAINFGSGWFPTLRKHDQPTGYRTIAAGIARRFEGPGPWSAGELAQIAVPELARLFGQDEVHPLMALFAQSLRDLGEHLLSGYDGAFEAVVVEAGGSAVKLVETLAGWSCFADVSTYAGRRVPFYKRAQIAAADLQRAGAADFDDLDRLTLFADNLVPHVLRLDDVLWFEPELVARIEHGELIEHGSAAEVEFRACALHAVELMVAELRAPDRPVPAETIQPTPITAADLDQYLWNRGQSPRYKSVPRPRSRSTAY